MKKIEVLILLTVLSLSIFAQYPDYGYVEKNKVSAYRGNLSNEDFFNKAEFIFEGIPISSKSFLTEAGEMYTSGIIKISEVYKGSLVVGTVEYISKGGRMMTPEGYKEDIPVGSKLNITMNKPQIFFCVKSKMPANPEKINKDNSTSLMALCNEHGALIQVGCYTCHVTYKKKIVGLNDLIFDTKEEFYEYIKQFKGIKIPSSVPEKSKDGGLNIKILEQKIKHSELMIKQNLLVKNVKKIISSPNNKNISTTNDLTLSIANQTITGSEVFYLEFDILAKANSSSTFLDNVLLRFDFNTTAFGTDLVASNKITVTKGVPFSNSTYETVAADASSTRVGINIHELNTEITSWNRTQLTTTSIQLLHVKIELLQNLNNVSSDIQFADTDIVGAYSMFTASSGAPWNQYSSYDNTYYNSPATFSISNIPVIDTDLSYYYMHAGIGEILEIYGTFFGNPHGKVLFKNADNGGLDFLSGLDDSYIVSWSNTHIQLKVPSYVLDGYFTAGEFGSAGSGEIQVESACQSVGESSSCLNIDYSITNWGSPLYGMPFDRVYLAKIDCELDIKFTLHSNMSGSTNANARAAIESVLLDWSLKLGISLGLEINNGQYVYVNDINATGKNVIAFTTDPNIRGMGTHRSFQAGNFAQNKYYRKSNSYIEVATYPANGTVTWNYNALPGNTVPAGQISFYQAFFHEIGHIVSLEHVNTASELMYWQINPNIQPATVLVINSSSNPVVASISKVVTPSLSITWDNLNISTLGTVVNYLVTDFIASQTSIVINQIITFSDLTTNSPTEWLWSITPNTGVNYISGSAISQNPQVQFANTGTYTISLASSNSCFSDNKTINNYITVSNQGFNVSGVINYMNTAHTPIYPATVKLMNGTTQVASTTTDASGNYSFTNIPNGNYQLKASTSKIWGGVTATDALKVKRHVAGSEIFNEAIKWSAADANNTTTINSTDVLKIQRRIAGLDLSFLRPDWNFEFPSIGGISLTVNNSNVTQPLYALCTGDVNGSYAPQILLKHASTALDYNSTIQVNTTDVFDLPIRISNAQEVGAMQLFIDYPTDLIDIVGVSMSSQENELIYNIVNGQLRIVWLSLQPLVLKENDPIVMLKLKAHDKNFTGQIQLNLQNESELANATGEVINTNLYTSMIDLSVVSDINSTFNIQHSTFLIFPNPAKNTLNIETNSYTKQKFEITDIIGQIVYSSFINRKVSIDTSHLTNGLYFIKLFTDNLTIIKRFVKE